VGKHPRIANWKTEASSDVAKVRSWWKSYPEANIGLATGKSSGFIVLDIDGPDGEATVSKMGVAPTPTVITGKGRQMYLKDPGYATKNRVQAFAELDNRGWGGLVVAAGSLHVSGAVYHWQDGKHPEDLPLADAPAWWLDAVRNGNGSLSAAAAADSEAPKWVARALRGVPEGSRDSTCARLAGYFLGRGMPADVVRSILVPWGGRCTPPFPESEVDKVLWSIEAKDAQGEASTEGIQAPFQCLGYNQGLFFYLPIGARQVVELQPKEHTQLNFLSLAPMPYWKRAYPGEQGPKWALAANALMRVAEAQGVYDPARIRGRGAWWDEITSESVLHLGDRIIAGGSTTRVQDLAPGRYVYEAAPALGLEVAGIEPLTSSEATHLVDLLGMVAWERPINPILLAGWIADALVCGALSWRPHIWITGAAGSGKTWVLDNILRQLLGTVGLSVASETTEAGLRQTLGHDARPVIFDEAEGEDQRAQIRMQNVVALMRQASSETGATIIKGSASGIAQSYRIRSCFAFSSIGVGLQQHADLTRVSVLTINPDKSADAPDKFRKLCAARTDLLTPDYIRRFQARIISMIPIIRKNATAFAAASAIELGSQRMGDQLGALLGGVFALYQDAPITPEAAATWLASHDWQESTALSDETTDENRCLQRILEHTVLIRTEPTTCERSIGELIQIALGRMKNGIKAAEAEATLNRNGIRTLAKECKFIVANQHRAVEKMLADTPWTRGWARILRRNPGAAATDQPLRFAGAKSRGTVIPWPDEKDDLRTSPPSSAPSAQERF